MIFTGDFQKWGYPKYGIYRNRDIPEWMVYFMENSIKIDYLGAPPFMETLTWSFWEAYSWEHMVSPWLSQCQSFHMSKKNRENHWLTSHVPSQSLPLISLPYVFSQGRRIHGTFHGKKWSSETSHEGRIRWFLCPSENHEGKTMKTFSSSIFMVKTDGDLMLINGDFYGWLMDDFYGWLMND